MRSALVLVALSGASALAQPAPPVLPPQGSAPLACTVNIVRAPDAVRSTVEAALAAETCTLSLQVRIIPTEGGLYVLATDANGRVHERVVPDAQSASVLITSWAAEDGLGGHAAPTSGGAPVGPPPAPMAPPPIAAYGGEFHPPGATPANGVGAGTDDDEYPIKPTEPEHPVKYLSIGAGLGANESEGLRGEIDFWGKNGWTFGGLFGLTSSHMYVYDYNSYQSSYDANVADYALALAVGHTSHWDNWHLRVGAAGGVLISSMDLGKYDQYGNYSTGSGTVTSPYIEASVMAGHTVGSSRTWALEGGLVFSYSRQEWYIQDTMDTLVRDAGNVMFVAGIRHGL